MAPEQTPADIYARPITTHGGNKYLRVVHPADGEGMPIRVDIYALLVAYEVICPGRQQAIKKLLCAGLRGKGSQVDDLRGAMDALWRAYELQKQVEEQLLGVPAVNPEVRAGDHPASFYEG